LSSFENKWVSFPYESPDGEGAKDTVASFIGVDPNVFDRLTAEQKEHISRMSKTSNFIKVTKRYSPEDVGGEMSYHFGFDLDRAGINSYLTSLKEYINTTGKNDSVLSSFDPVLYDTSIEKLEDF